MAALDSKFLVRVGCMTYNHSSFITATMDGFAMQQTSFPFVCTIIDDASTDGEQDVLKDYLDKFFDLQDTSVKDGSPVLFARHKTNPNCFFAVVLLKENHYGKKKSKAPYIAEWLNTKYVALCEGDDYWTDSTKLQKQASYMESHPDCSLCFHNAIIHWYDGREPDSLFAEFEERDYNGVELCKEWLTPTASFFFRTFIYDDFARILKEYPQICIGDSPLLLSCAKAGIIHGFPDVMCVYGKHSAGWTQYSDCRRTFQSARSWEAQRAAFGKEYHKVMTDTLTGQYLLTIYRAFKEKDWAYVWKGFYRGVVRQPITGIKALLKVLKERES